MNYFISIIMPCYKGEDFIENSIDTVIREVSLFENNFEIIVVIDGFVDRGYDKAKVLEKRYRNLKVIGYERNRGKGYAIQYGFKHSKGEYIAFLDSDMDYHPKVLACFIKKIQEEDADLVIGNRRDKKSIFQSPILRKIAGRAFNVYINFLFPGLNVNDTQAGIKMIRSDAAQKVFERLAKEEESNGFIFDICLLVIAKQNGLKILQAPSIFEMKSSTIGVSGNFIRTAFKMGEEVWRFRKKYYSK